MATILQDIMIDGKSYRIDLPSYKVKDIVDFAPRASVPGGSVVMSDLGLYQPLVQSDFRRGFGFLWYSDAAGYMNSFGDMDTRQDGLAMRFTQKTASDTNDNAKEGFTTFNGALYAWGAGGLRKYASDTWTSITASAVNFALAAGDYMFYCPDGARLKKMDLAGTSTDAGLDASSIDYKWMVIHNGFIFAGVDGTNRVHYTDQADASDLEGTTSDPGYIPVGLGNVPTIGAISYAGSLYVSRQDGLWQIGEDFIARKVVDYGNESSSVNFRSMAIVNGFLVYPIRDHLIQWNGVRVNDITPDKINDSFPYTTYGRFDNLVSVDNFLYFTGRTNEASYDEALLCFDGAGFHKLSDLVEDSSSQTVTAMGYDVVNHRLWYHLDASSDVTYYIQLQQNSPFPYANFNTSGSHGFITSRMDMGFLRVQKSMTSLIVNAENVSETRYIQIEYQLDGTGDWFTWDTITDSGVTELMTPGGFPTREFYYLQLRFTFVTDDTEQSPILNDYTIRFLMRPMVQYGWNFNIVAATSTPDDEGLDERAASEIVKEIRGIRNSKAPVKYVDVVGDEYIGYITAISEQPTYRRETAEGEYPDIEYTVNVNFIEVGE